MWSVHAGPVFHHCNFEISVQRSVPDMGVQQDTECGITPILNVRLRILPDPSDSSSSNHPSQLQLVSTHLARG
jgi:hypothetical protein